MKNVKRGEQFFSNYYPGQDPEVACSNQNIPNWYVESWREFQEKYPEKASKYTKSVLKFAKYLHHEAVDVLGGNIVHH